MALVPPGAENPSAAFLAGAQHGAALAVQHHLARTQVYSPRSVPQVASGGSPTLNDLLGEVRGIANQETQAQINAIRGQQNLYQTQAQNIANQTLDASQAAAQLIANLGLGDQTANSYNTAAQDIAGLAQGLSGQTQTDAANAADAVAAQLKGLGAPAGSARTATGQASNPAALGNVLYGLGGFIPGNVLETTGQAQAAAQRQLPLSTLAYGQQMATGELATGKSNADALTQNILNAAANEPALYQSLLSSLNSTLTNESLAQSLIGSRANSSQVAQQNANTRATQVANTAAYQQGRLAVSRSAAAAKAKAAKAGKPLTEPERVKAAGLANSIAEGAFNGATDKKGNPLPALSYPAALGEMRNAGLLADPRSATIALDALNRLYQPGTRGRPYLSSTPSMKRSVKITKAVLPLPFGGALGG